MKIALIGPTYPFRGGISHYTSLLYHHLKKKHEVRFYKFSRFYPKFLYPGDSSPDSSKMPVPEVNAMSIIDWANPFSWYRTGLLIAKWAPDAVVFPWWMWGWAIPFWIIGKVVSLRGNIKILFICHNVIEHETASWKNVFSKLVLSIGDAFIVHSQGDHDNLKKIFPDARVMMSFHPTYEIFRCTSIPKGEAKEKLKVDSRFRKTILFFGIIRSYKGLRYLIEAMPMIISKIPDLCLIIAGEFWERKESYLRRISDLHVDGRIKLVSNYIPNEEVALYFSAADVVILPYTSGTGSGVVQIAFGFDKPVIATKVGCLPEVVDDGRTGLLVEPMDSHAIADAVISFYRKKMEHVFQRNISLEKERFSWKRVVENITELAKPESCPRYHR